MADENESFEDRIRAVAREVGQSIEHAAEQIDLDQLADKIGVSSERVREVAEFAGQWLSQQFAEGESPFDFTGRHRADAEQSGPQSDEPIAAADPTPFTAPAEPSGPKPRRVGPHPLDMPSEDQGLALSALDSGRWRVEPGTNELISHGEGPDPQDAVGLVGELRARDWIAATGEVTLVGRDALKRWLGRPSAD